MENLLKLVTLMFLRRDIAKKNKDVRVLNVGTYNLEGTSMGYNVFTIKAPDDGNPLSGREKLYIITKRTKFLPNENVTVYRLNNTVYSEV